MLSKSLALKEKRILGWLSGLVPAFGPGCDRVPHWALCMELASPSACLSLSLCVSLMNKWIKSF